MHLYHQMNICSLVSQMEPFHHGDSVDEQHLRSSKVTIAVLATKQPHLNLLTELQPRSCSQPRSTTLRVRTISFVIDHLQLHICCNPASAHFAKVVRGGFRPRSRTLKAITRFSCFATVHLHFQWLTFGLPRVTI